MPSLHLFLQLLLLLFFCINGFWTNPTSAATNKSKILKSSKESSSDNVMHFEMIHRHSPELLGGRTLSHSERIKDLFHVDKVRRELKSQKKKTPKHKESEGRKWGHNNHNAGDNSSFSLPMVSGLYAGSGTYYVPFRVGTPAQKFLLMMDTGSDLTWIACKDGANLTQGQGHYMRGATLDDEGSYVEDDKRNRTRIFHPERSVTFKTIPCSSRLCTQILPELHANSECPAPKAPCSYDYPYMSGDHASGVFAYESVTVNLANGRKKKIPGMLIGCNVVRKQGNPTSDTFGHADGIFGLGFSTQAFVFNVYKSFRGKFSYCIMDRASPKNMYNYLTFGHRSKDEMPPNMQYTELKIVDDLYGVFVEAIYVGGVKLDIPAELWNANIGNGLVLDTGTSLSYWSTAAFAPIVAAIEKPIFAKYPRWQSDVFQSCFNVTNFINVTDFNSSTDGKPPSFDDSVVPSLEIEFKSGARLKPPVSSYIIPQADTLWCIGFLELKPEDEGNSQSLLGNIMQHNHLWEFNAFRSQVGFAPSTCILRHHYQVHHHG